MVYLILLYLIHHAAETAKLSARRCGVGFVETVAYAPKSVLGRMAYGISETMPKGDVVEETHNRQPVWAPSAQTQHRIYMAVAGVLFLPAVLMAFGRAILRDQRFDLPMSDGRYYYAYLPSVVIDGDLDFANQVLEHWDQSSGRKSWRIGPRRARSETSTRSDWL